MKTVVLLKPCVLHIFLYGYHYCNWFISLIRYRNNLFSDPMFCKVYCMIKTMNASFKNSRNYCKGGLSQFHCNLILRCDNMTSMIRVYASIRVWKHAIHFNSECVGEIKLSMTLIAVLMIVTTIRSMLCLGCVHLVRNWQYWQIYLLTCVVILPLHSSVLTNTSLHF